MSTNPYATPEANCTESSKPAGPIKAVLVGLVVDVGGSTVMGIMLSIAYGVSLASSGMSAEQITETLSQEPSMSWFSIASFTLGCAFSVLGGFICTRLAQRKDYKLGIILSGMSILSGLLLSFGQYSLPLNIMLAILTFASVMLGTKIGMSKA